MSSKEALRQRFGADPERYYRVQLFDQRGFVRRRCQSCGKFFWTLDERTLKCPDPPCTSYGFIGRSPAKVRLDYISAWQRIKRFFVKAGHTAIPSYPVVCRWFPGLYFNIASIVSFQRMAGKLPVFEFPANPLIIPQVCLRFNDIPNVGLSGRHHTSFIMIGQHAAWDGKSGYWKDRCIELDWQLLTKVLRIPENEISFVEDVWIGPSAFGYSLEYFVRGLELGNAVFTEFLGSPENYKVMENKIVDMGAGHERFVWLISGTPTSYDACFGPVMAKLKAGIDYDAELWQRYATFAGSLNLESAPNLAAAKAAIAKALGIRYERLKQATEKLEALYAIADHAKTLLYAVTDGALPSNVGGGYNLRVILRRALGFIDNFKFDIDLFEVCRGHAKYLKQLDKRLSCELEQLKEILELECARARVHRGRALSMVARLLEQKQPLDFTKLYESHGITPELIAEVARLKRISLELPSDTYVRLTERHMGEAEEAAPVIAEALPPTRALFYKTRLKRFTARVLRIIDKKWVLLDQSAFYGRAGGQEPDTGWLNGSAVYDVQKIGDAILHAVEDPKFDVGDLVEGQIDWPRRQQLTVHHTAAHIIGAASKQILGSHVWQAGSLKDVRRARLDITHHSRIDQRQLDMIERLANRIVKKNVPVKKIILPRRDAEARYGFRLYQGGAVPSAKLRVVEIPHIDAQACGGLHVDRTSQVGKIVLTSSERIADGVVRLNFLAGAAAQTWLEEQDGILKHAAEILGVKPGAVLSEVKRLLSRCERLRKARQSAIKATADELAKQLEQKFVKNSLIEVLEGADMAQLKQVSRKLSSHDRFLLLFGLADKIYVWAAAGKGTAIDAGKIVKRVCAALGGKGGGTAALAQGVGLRRQKLSALLKQLRDELYE